MKKKISKAFVLGAGLGTRLRPLTNSLPKPLIPVWNAPLISFVFDHLIHDLGVSHFMVNTHHAASRYHDAFPKKRYRDCPVEFRHEPVLLDTAGGLDNVRDWLPSDESFAVYNGDILTDLPLNGALEQHLESGNIATLVLRSRGHNRNVAWDETSGQIYDLRNALGSNADNLFQFTGIYLAKPEFFSYLIPGKIESVVFSFLRAIEEGQQIGGALSDQGAWRDLGDESSYLDTLNLFAGGTENEDGFPRFGLADGKCRIHPQATIDPAAQIDSLSVVGRGAVISRGAVIEESVIWPGAAAAPEESVIRRVIWKEE